MKTFKQIWDRENMSPKRDMQFHCVNNHHIFASELLFDEVLREARCPICKHIIRFGAEYR